MSGISLFAVMAVGILFMGLFVWLLVLVIRALRKYIRSEPARTGASVSAVQAERRSAVGNARPPGISVPSSVQSRSKIPLMRGMLLFWEMMNEHSASHGSCRRMRMPGAKAAASRRTGCRSQSARRIAA